MRVRRPSCGATRAPKGPLLGAFPRARVLRYCVASRHVSPGPTDCVDVQVEAAAGARRALRLQLGTAEAARALVAHLRATDAPGRSLEGSCAPTPVKPGKQAGARAPLFELQQAPASPGSHGVTPRQTPRQAAESKRVTATAATQTPSRPQQQQSEEPVSHKGAPEKVACGAVEAATQLQETPRTAARKRRDAALAYIHADYMFAAAAAEATLSALADRQRRQRKADGAGGGVTKAPVASAPAGPAAKAKLPPHASAKEVARAEASAPAPPLVSGASFSGWANEGHGRWKKDDTPDKAVEAAVSSPVAVQGASTSHSPQSGLRFSTGNDFADMVAELDADAAAGPIAEELAGRGVAGVLTSPDARDTSAEWRASEQWADDGKVMPREGYRRGRRELFKADTWEGPHEPFSGRADGVGSVASPSRVEYVPPVRRQPPPRGGARAQSALTAGPSSRRSNVTPTRPGARPASAVVLERPTQQTHAAPPAIVDEWRADYQDGGPPNPARTALGKLAAVIGVVGGPNAAVEIFKGFDADNDGSVDEEEFRRGLAELGMSFDDAQMAEVMAFFDEDGSGEIEYVELAARMDALPGSEGHSVSGTVLKLKNALIRNGMGDSIAEAFGRFDEDGDGSISRAEFIRGVVSLDLGLSFSEARQLADTFDEDGDGEVDYHEFAGRLQMPANATRGPAATHAPRPPLAEARGQPQPSQRVATAASLDALRRKQRRANASRARAHAGESGLLAVLAERIDAIGGKWQLRDIFRRYDVDRAGSVSRAHFVQILGGLRLKMSATQVRQLATLADPAGTGRIRYNALIDRATTASSTAPEGGAEWLALDAARTGRSPDRSGAHRRMPQKRGSPHKSQAHKSPRAEVVSPVIVSPAASPEVRRSVQNDIEAGGLVLAASTHLQAAAPQSGGNAAKAGGDSASRLARLRMLSHTAAMRALVSRVRVDSESASRTLSVLDVVGDGRLTSDQLRYGLGLLAPGSEPLELSMIVDAHDLRGERYTEFADLLLALQAMAAQDKRP